MTIGSMPPCMYCNRMKDEDKDSFNFVCEAFPEGIPIEIVDMEIIHDKPIEGDRGLIYDGMVDISDLNDNG